MRQTISGLVAAVAVMTAGAAPALACGFTSCSPCATEYVSPCVPTYALTVVGTGCITGCGFGWTYQRLAEPTTQYYPTTEYSAPRQYYYVNQGPTYSGPGMFAPYPTYQESALGAYERAPYYHGHHRHHYAPRY
jgi:hypothetical protein